MPEYLRKKQEMLTSKIPLMLTCLDGKTQKCLHAYIKEPSNVHLSTWQKPETSTCLHHRAQSSPLAYMAKLRQVNMSTSQNPVMPTCLHQRTHKCPPFYLKVPPSPPQTKITRNEKYKPEKYRTSDVSTS